MDAINAQNSRQAAHAPLFTPSAQWATAAMAALVCITSLSGIFLEKTYARETQNWALQGIGQDWANLIVVALLLASGRLAARGSVRGFLAWMGTLFYLLYSFAIYAFCVHFNFLFLAYVAVLGISFHTLIGAARRVNAPAMERALMPNPAASWAATLLIAVGALFYLLWLGEIVPSLLTGNMPQNMVETGLWVNPVHVLDLAFLLPGMIFTGVALLRNNVWGYVLAVPFMVFAVTMGLGILLMFLVFALNGLPVPLPAVLFIGATVLASAYVAFLFLQNIRED